MNKRKICVVTGTRSEYGLLYWLMKEIHSDAELELQLVVTGMHLSPEFGLTYKQIEEDGFKIDKKVEILLSSDTSVGVVKSIGIATIGFADVLDQLKPDLIVILGDRFEMLAVSQAALIIGIPIAHLHGGELTFGAFDDSIRHSITKLATWHFTSTEEHKQRVIQLGESPDRVWNVGALGIENILKVPLLSKDELYNQLSLDKKKSLLLITYHPETHGDRDGIHPLLRALSEYSNVNLLFTKANADNGGRYINEEIEKYTKQNETAFLFDSLGQLRYLSAVKHADSVIGNSSSGLIEVPYLQTPTVNCGNRQVGRQRPSSVFDVELDEKSIKNGIEQALQYAGPYEQIFGDGNASRKIVEILKEIPSYLIQKEFYDL
ncbi:UDP-N-acetylglucosamine 2-epimerase (non-hydrolyzing) [Paenibacillus sp. PastF-3]|uniref:UDP-N-acetylglucosamine 2-epimerase n=1 Tax=Paenibacillus sp. PastF-3 TaxID=2940626 RepID=UPI0024734AA9|nr:UDP-N-acetylglucosamine 2-epimerase [Paenibacillus sp. PastF-3]MDH6371048.1 UDP-N-acetylglucosamine 2-epimerase (non-hydrolyzing) [Paenibacillus sp. PastF-3]